MLGATLHVSGAWAHTLLVRALAYWVGVTPDGSVALMVHCTVSLTSAVGQATKGPKPQKRQSVPSIHPKPP